MKTTTKIVALTTQTKNELQINEQACGTLERVGRRLYTFIQRVRQKRNPMPEEVCQKLAYIKKGNTRGQIYANGYGVTVHLYIRHTEYNNTRELKAIIQDRINDLCNQL